MSHAASRRGPAHASAPHARAMPPNGGGQRCTEVYCIPETVPAPAPPKGSAPNATALPPNVGGQRCTEVYCVPQPVPRRPATFAAPA